eukprot:1889162-Rhodomonas_salina.3
MGAIQRSATEAAERASVPTCPSSAVLFRVTRIRVVGRTAVVEKGGTNGWSQFEPKSQSRRFCVRQDTHKR